MNRSLFAATIAFLPILVGAPGCESLASKESDAERIYLGREQQDLYVLSTAVWGTGDIPVCWEQPGFETEKGWVRDQIAKSWEAEGNVEFTGWARCGALSKGIRIQIADVNPHTQDLGKRIDGLANGMVLDFTMVAWPNTGACQGAAREQCIRSIAAHEFGHALGLAHEQNRADTPSSCTKPPQAANGDTTVGAWDLSSIMDYCNPVYNNNGFLSATDTQGLTQFYGARKPISAVARAANLIDTLQRGMSGDLLTNSYNAIWFPFDLGGSVTGAPSIAGRGASRLDAFARGPDGRLYWTYWEGTLWSGFVPLGTEAIVGSPVAVALSGTRVDVVVKGTDSRLYRKSLNGVTWDTSYTSLGSAQVVGTSSLVSRGANLMDVFVRGMDSTLYTASFNGSTWTNLYQLAPHTIRANPTSISRSPGQIDVFVRGSDDALYVKSWNGVSWSSGYTQLGTSSFLGDPSVASFAPGRLDVFVRGTDSTLYTRSWQLTAASDSAPTKASEWTGYSQLGTSKFLASPSVVSWGANRLDVFVRGTDSLLYWKSWNGSAWSGYSPAGGNTFN